MIPSDSVFDYRYTLKRESSGELENAPARKKKKLTDNEEQQLLHPKKKLTKNIVSLQDFMDVENVQEDSGTTAEILLKEEQRAEFKRMMLSEKVNMMDEDERRILESEGAEEVIRQKMKKWGKVVDFVEGARKIPIVYSHQKITRPRMNEDAVILDAFNLKLKEKHDNQKIVDFYESNLEPEKMTKEEMIERARKLAEKRRLLQQQSKKFSRLKKIKSKAFRKKARQRKQREEEKNAQLSQLSGELDKEEVQKMVEKDQQKYFQERITLKHKNQSRWIKRASRFSHENSNFQAAVNDHFEIKEKLKNLQSKRENEDSDDDLIDELLNEETRNEAIAKLKELSNDEPKGIFAMEFMKKSKQKRNEEIFNALEDMDKEDDETENLQNRQSFNPNPTHLRELLKEPKDKDDMILEEGTKTFAVKSEGNGDIVVKEAEEEEISYVAKSRPRKRKRFQTSVDQPVKRVKKSAAMEENFEDPNHNPWLSAENQTKKARISNLELRDMDENEEMIHVEPIDSPHAQKSQAETEISKEEEYQREIKRSAFAADDVEFNFEQEKNKVIDQEIDMPELQTKLLPGWGTDWIGKNTNYKEQLKKQQMKLNDIKESVRKVKEQDRADASLSHVIIRDTVKVPEKYLNQTIRNSIQNPHQKRSFSKIYDNQTSMPIGPEWNSTKGYEGAIEPRLQTKPGRTIEPMAYKEMTRAIASQIRHGNYKKPTDIRNSDKLKQLNEAES